VRVASSGHTHVYTYMPGYELWAHSFVPNETKRRVLIFRHLVVEEEGGVGKMQKALPLS